MNRIHMEHQDAPTGLDLTASFILQATKHTDATHLCPNSSNTSMITCKLVQGEPTEYDYWYGKRKKALICSDPSHFSPLPTQGWNTSVSVPIMECFKWNCAPSYKTIISTEVIW